MEDDRKTRLVRIFGLSLLSFGVLLSYSLTRPAVESLFLEVHTQKGEPMAWVLVALGVTLTVSIYNRFVARTDLVRMYGVSTMLSAVVLSGLLLARQAGLPGSYYLLYMFKDIYIVVLVEAFYTLANAVYPIRSARWLYGLFGAIGGLGGMLGNFTSGMRLRRRSKIS